MKSKILAIVAGLGLAASAFGQAYNLTYASGYGTGAVPLAALITINKDGSIAITNPTGAAPYDGADDSLIGIVNNSATALSSISLSGSYIFGFDGSDGIDYYIGLTPTAWDNSNSGYGGSNAYFNVVDVNDGTVLFNTPIAGNGGTGYFSLEENLAAQGAITVTGTNSVPDATSTLPLLGGVLVALVALRRRFVR